MDKNHLIFDYQSSTPCSLEVVKEMAPYWNQFWGNPSNLNNRSGLFASAAVGVAREKIASYLKINSERLIFTSGATEANNLALIGHSRAKAKLLGKTGHIITVSTEHHAVLDPLRHLRYEGFRLTELKPNEHGLVNVDQISNSLEEDTFLVSVMAANNEIGVLQPISEIGSFCRERGRGGDRGRADEGSVTKERPARQRQDAYYHISHEGKPADEGTVRRHTTLSPITLCLVGECVL